MTSATAAEWEAVDPTCRRMKVAGGWIYETKAGLCFVPDIMN